MRPASADSGAGRPASPCRDSTNSFARSHQRAQAKMHRAARASSADRRAGPRWSAPPLEARGLRLAAPRSRKCETGAFNDFVDLLSASTAAEAATLVSEAMRLCLPRDAAAGGGMSSTAALQRALSAPSLGTSSMLAEQVQMRRARSMHGSATRLQAAWRGRTMRRVCRFLRAQLARHRRLCWLADLEEMTLFLRLADAATSIQATFRALRDAKKHGVVRSATQRPHATRHAVSGRRLSWRDSCSSLPLCDVTVYDPPCIAAWPQPRYV